MRILAVTLRYPPYVAGGYELLTRDAVDALRARGHEVTVLAGRGEQFAGERDVLPWLEPDLDRTEHLFGLSHEGSNAERFRLHFLRGSNLAATRRAIRQTAAEAVFCFNLGLVSLAPLLAARVVGVPTLTYVSDPWPANHWLRDWEADPRQAAKAFRLSFLRRAWSTFRDLVGLGELFTCSGYLRDVLTDSGIASASVSVLHLGVPPDMEALASRREPSQRDPGEPLRVVCLSSFWEGKGQDVLLDAVARARAAGAPVELVLAGNGRGAFRDELVERAAEPDLQGAVRFEQDLDREAVSDLLLRSHVFVLPSLWGEPFALSTLEGMAHGLAVVVSDAGGSPEALNDGVHGVIVPAGEAQPLAEALRRLEADEGVRMRLGRAARERAMNQLSHPVFVDELETRLERLVQS